jgi:MYXO-CTERM domain-containing protein
VVSVKDANGVTTAVQITVGPGITVMPGMTTVGSRGAISLKATGGSGMGYIWSLAKNRSGGTIDATTGAYTAGTVVSGTVTDTITVTDSLGNEGSAAIEVTRAKNITIGGGSGCDCATAGNTPNGRLAAVALLALACGLTRTRIRRRQR